MVNFNKIYSRDRYNRYVKPKKDALNPDNFLDSDGKIPNAGNVGDMSDGQIDSMAAAVTRAEWTEYMERYIPNEKNLVSLAMQTNFKEEGDQAGSIANKQFRVHRQGLNRQLAQSGNKLSKQERQGLTRRMSIARTTSVAGAENTTRTGLRDTHLAALANSVGIGRGVATTATQGLDAAAAGASARQTAAAQNDAAKKAQKYQTMGTLASLAMMAVILK